MSDPSASEAPPLSLEAISAQYERLLRAQLARRAGEDGIATAALAQARALAAQSGVRQLQLHIALEAARAGEPDRLGEDGPTLDEATARLGHAGLRLAWLEWRMREALAGAEPAPSEALAAWREASALLREGDYARAHRLQALAARALAASGDKAAADAAGARAERSFQAMRDALPVALRAGFEDRDASAIATLEPSQ